MNLESWLCIGLCHHLLQKRTILDMRVPRFVHSKGISKKRIVSPDFATPYASPLY
jgi:hypothetical protein